MHPGSFASNHKGTGLVRKEEQFFAAAIEEIPSKDETESIQGGKGS
jgi:hypothetical protein